MNIQEPPKWIACFLKKNYEFYAKNNEQVKNKWVKQVRKRLSGAGS